MKGYQYNDFVAGNPNTNIVDLVGTWMTTNHQHVHNVYLLC